MAKDVASRVSSDEEVAAQELQERAERSAARFDSIHSRWSAVNGKAPAAEAGSSEAAAADSAAADAVSPDEAWIRAEDTSSTAGAEVELDPGSVRVTPIVGIATAEGSEAAPRPRFKTLMGVPRNSPEIDELAGLDGDLRWRHDTVRLERSALRPPAPATDVPGKAAPAEPGSSAAEARSSSRDVPSLAATSWPWERNAPVLKQAARVAPPQWSALVESSLDVSAEVAALRPSTARRSWLVGLAGIAALVALFAVGAPRERALALRWLNQEYQARVNPSAQANMTAPLTDNGRALRPTASLTAPGAVGSAAPAMARSAVSRSVALEATVAASSATPLPSPPGPASPTPALPEASLPAATAQAAPILAVADDKALAGDGSEKKRAQVTAARVAAPKATGAGVTAAKITAPKATAAVSREARSGTGSTASARVAAPRKPSQEPTALAANVTKPRAARQNSPRKDAGGGIIRVTPF
jgi:hypothetical protein